MHGVVRFEDLRELGLPASSPANYPKVIRSGIDEEGQHRKSPPITAKDGIMMVLRRLEHPEYIKRLLDIDGTRDFELSLDMKDDFMKDAYVRRHGRLVEIGLRTKADPFPEPGIRYWIHDANPTLPYTIGPWEPESTTNTYSEWCTKQTNISSQGESIAKALWFQKYWNATLGSVSWTGMDDSARADIARSDAERMAKVRAQREKERMEYEAQQAEASQSDMPYDLVAMPKNYGKRLRRCRADCGAEECTLECTKCKLTRYCSRECQLDDWKYHKSICGTEEGPDDGGVGFMRMAYNSRWNYESQQA